jgi:cob(I)alamin adenosyltransferase
MSEESPGAEVTTRTGDLGQTGLLGPDRVSKTDLRIEALGALDEASSALGLARSLCDDVATNGLVIELQQGLYTAMAQVAALGTKGENRFTVGVEDVARLEAIEDDLKRTVSVGKSFVIPGGSQGGAALDLARTIVRRGERQVVALTESGLLNDEQLGRWMNRLSDVVFVLARRVDGTEGSSSSGSYRNGP